mmetsp:Transcript_27161/g.84483  ORF Transcript_27161/g.84483 Transcript_27161/m.84483 type:complete len:209 (-) Transcript_27161:95-721(-)
MRTMAITLPAAVTGTASPYPTVVIVAADHQSASSAVLIEEPAAIHSTESTEMAPTSQTAMERKPTMTATESARTSFSTLPICRVAMRTRRTWRYRNWRATRMAEDTLLMCSMLCGMQRIKSTAVQMNDVVRLTVPHALRRSSPRSTGTTCLMMKSTKKNPQTTLSACTMIISSMSFSCLERPSMSSGMIHSTMFRTNTRADIEPRNTS